MEKYIKIPVGVFVGFLDGLSVGFRVGPLVGSLVGFSGKHDRNSSQFLKKYQPQKRIH